MKFKEIYKNFLQIEDELDLFSQKIDNVYFWERIRFKIFSEILQASGFGQAHLKLEKNVRNKIWSSYLLVKNLIIRNPFLATQSDFIFFGHPRRKLLEDGKWWDIYCDPIIEYLNHSYLFLEKPYLNTHFTPSKTSNLRYLDLPMFLSALKRELGLVRVSFTAQDRKLLKELQVQIKDKLDVDIDIEKHVFKTLVVRKSELPIYEYLLKKLNPNLAIVVVSYNKETLIEICKHLSIPVVELQHGVITPYHVGYSFPGPKRTKYTFPDYLFTFGDFWKESVEFPISKDQIYSVGYPFLEMEVKKYAKTEKMNQILFISQGTIGKEMSKFAFELSKREDLKYRIVYKLHPGEFGRWRKEYPWLNNSNIKVIEDEMPLYKLFAQSKVQIGVYSTAIYEGLYFGLKTFLLNLPGVEYMNQLIEDQYALLVSSVEEFMEITVENRVKNINTEKFFKTNSVNNIVAKINEIINYEQGS